MALVSLSDKQTVDTAKIKIVKLRDDDLLIVYKDEPGITVTGITIKGPRISDDADLLDEMRDREKLPYLVFREPKAK
jgi:hypothetical protein